MYVFIVSSQIGSECARIQHMTACTARSATGLDMYLVFMGSCDAYAAGLQILPVGDSLYVEALMWTHRGQKGLQIDGAGDYMPVPLCLSCPSLLGFTGLRVTRQVLDRKSVV